MNHQILVILSPGFEEVEAITVIDILRRAKLSVTTASLEEARTVMGSHGIYVTADATLSEISERNFTCIALPGGMRGVENMLASEALLAQVRRIAESGAVLAAVCAAPLVLDKLGLLRDSQFTCHPCVHERVTSNGLTQDATVIDGNIVTGRSAGCAMPWSLKLVEKLTGELPPALLDGLRLP